MIRILGYNWLKVGKKLNLYPNYVLEWVLSEMLAVPLITHFLTTDKNGIKI